MNNIRVFDSAKIYYSFTHCHEWILRVAKPRPAFPLPILILLQTLVQWQYCPVARLTEGWMRKTRIFKIFNFLVPLHHKSHSKTFIQTQTRTIATTKYDWQKWNVAQRSKVCVKSLLNIDFYWNFKNVFPLFCADF